MVGRQEGPAGESRTRGLLAHPGLRLLVVWACEALGLLLAAWVLPGVRIEGTGSAVTAIALIGVLNAVLYPLLTLGLLSVAAPVFGVLALVLNGVIVVIAGALDRGFHVDGLGPAIVTMLILTLVNSLASGLLAIDDEGSFHRSVVRRQARRVAKRAGRVESGTPGLFFLEIDGLSEEILRRAVAEGYMPTLAGWIDGGSHVLTGWECDLSSQTAASQAGLLHGTNENIPAFRWYDRELGRTFVSAQPGDAVLLQQRVSNGRGLLADDGASRANMLTGDSAHAALTISVISQGKQRGTGATDAWKLYLGNPYNLPRTLLLFLGDVITERRAARVARKGAAPQANRGGKYPLVRAGTTSFLVDVTVNMLIGDLLAGVPSAYATFVAYDEIAHHSGPDAPDALAILTRLDRQFARIEAATRLAPRPYEFVVLSDHGQSQGRTFLQRYGRSLEAVVRDLTAAGASVAGGGNTAEEAAQQLGFAFNEAAVDAPAATAWAAKRAQAGVLGGEAPKPGKEAPEAEGEVVVFGSGNLGLVYLTGCEQRPTLEQIDRLHPELVRGLAAHPGVAFVAAITERGGAVAIGAGGTHDLRSGAVTGTDPLLPLGPRAAAHIARELGFTNAPDLLLGGAYDPADGEVSAFEELVGSHGGLGGPQAHPFVLHPAGLKAPADDLVGAAAVHHLFKAWLAQLAAGAPPAAAEPEPEPAVRSA